MAYDAETAITIWPEYFDLERTRANGRKAPKNLCVKNPSLDILTKGAMIMDLEYEVFESKRYPGNWASSQGCIRIERGKFPKTELIVKLGEILIKNQR